MVTLLSQSVDRNKVWAQLLMSRWLRKGLYGLKPSVTAAASMLEKAAIQGDPQAMFLYGVCLYNGDGVENDDRRAAKLFIQAAKKGHSKVSRD